MLCLVCGERVDTRRLTQHISTRHLDYAVQRLVDLHTGHINVTRSVQTDWSCEGGDPPTGSRDAAGIPDASHPQNHPGDASHPQNHPGDASHPQNHPGNGDGDEDVGIVVIDSSSEDETGPLIRRAPPSISDLDSEQLSEDISVSAIGYRFRCPMCKFFNSSNRIVKEHIKCCPSQQLELNPTTGAGQLAAAAATGAIQIASVAANKPRKPIRQEMLVGVGRQDVPREYLADAAHYRQYGGRFCHTVLVANYKFVEEPVNVISDLDDSYHQHHLKVPRISTRLRTPSFTESEVEERRMGKYSSDRRIGKPIETDMIKKGVPVSPSAPQKSKSVSPNFVGVRKRQRVRIEKSNDDTSVLEKDNTDTSVTEKDDIDNSMIEKDNADTSMIEKDNVDTSMIEKDNPDTNVVEKDNPDTSIIEEGNSDTSMMEKDNIDSRMVEEDNTDTNVIMKQNDEESVMEENSTEKSDMNSAKLKDEGQDIREEITGALNHNNGHKNYQSETRKHKKPGKDGGQEGDSTGPPNASQDEVIGDSTAVELAGDRVNSEKVQSGSNDNGPHASSPSSESFSPGRPTVPSPRSLTESLAVSALENGAGGPKTPTRLLPVDGLFCRICDYTASDKWKYVRHVNTLGHIDNVNQDIKSKKEDEAEASDVPKKTKQSRNRKEKAISNQEMVGKNENRPKSGLDTESALMEKKIRSNTEAITSHVPPPLIGTQSDARSQDVAQSNDGASTVREPDVQSDTALSCAHPTDVELSDSVQSGAALSEVPQTDADHSDARKHPEAVLSDAPQSNTDHSDAELSKVAISAAAQSYPAMSDAVLSDNPRSDSVLPEGSLPYSTQSKAVVRDARPSDSSVSAEKSSLSAEQRVGGAPVKRGGDQSGEEVRREVHNMIELVPVGEEEEEYDDSPISSPLENNVSSGPLPAGDRDEDICEDFEAEDTYLILVEGSSFQAEDSNKIQLNRQNPGEEIGHHKLPIKTGVGFDEEPVSDHADSNLQAAPEPVTSSKERLAVEVNGKMKKRKRGRPKKDPGVAPPLALPSTAGPPPLSNRPGPRSRTRPPGYVTTSPELTDEEEEDKFSTLEYQQYVQKANQTYSRTQRKCKLSSHQRTYSVRVTDVLKSKECQRYLTEDQLLCLQVMKQELEAGSRVRKVRPGGRGAATLSPAVKKSTSGRGTKQQQQQLQAVVDSSTKHAQQLSLTAVGQQADGGVGIHPLPPSQKLDVSQEGGEGVVAEEHSATTSTTSELPTTGRAMRRSRPRRKEGEALQKLLADLLNSLVRWDVHNWFSIPLTEKSAPGYSSLITEPMDFSTMENRLDQGQYTTLDLFRYDVNLISSNCLKYNKPDTKYHVAASKLEVYATTLLSRRRIVEMTRSVPIYQDLTPFELGFDVKEFDSDPESQRISDLSNPGDEKITAEHINGGRRKSVAEMGGENGSSGRDSSPREGTISLAERVKFGRRGSSPAATLSQKAPTTTLKGGKKRKSVDVFPQPSSGVQRPGGQAPAGDTMSAGANKRFKGADPPPSVYTSSEDESAGTFVQCCRTSCLQWRRVREFATPAQVPEYWDCSMNKNVRESVCINNSGSNSNREETLTGDNFTQGTLVWALVSGYPWWPGMILACPDSGLFTWVNRKRWYHVVFFDKVVCRCWLQEQSVQLLKSTDQPPPLKNTPTTSTATSSPAQLKPSIKSRYNRAVAIAGEYMELTLPDRLVKFPGEDQTMDDTGAPRRKLSGRSSYQTGTSPAGRAVANRHTTTTTTGQIADRSTSGETLGAEFECGRCGETLPRSRQPVVAHLADQHRLSLTAYCSEHDPRADRPEYAVLREWIDLEQFQRALANHPEKPEGIPVKIGASGNSKGGPNEGSVSAWGTNAGGISTGGTTNVGGVSAGGTTAGDIHSDEIIKQEEEFTKPGLSSEVLIALSARNLEVKGEEGASLHNIVSFLSLFFPYYNRNYGACETLVRLASCQKAATPLSRSSINFRVKPDIVRILHQEFQDTLATREGELAMALLSPLFLETLVGKFQHGKDFIHPAQQHPPPFNDRDLIFVGLLGLRFPATLNQLCIFLPFLFPGFSLVQSRTWRTNFSNRLDKEPALEVRRTERADDDDEEEERYIIRADCLDSVRQRLTEMFVGDANTTARNRLRLAIFSHKYINVLLPELKCEEGDPFLSTSSATAAPEPVPIASAAPPLTAIQSTHPLSHSSQPPLLPSSILSSAPLPVSLPISLHRSGKNPTHFSSPVLSSSPLSPPPTSSFSPTASRSYAVLFSPTKNSATVSTSPSLLSTSSPSLPRVNSPTTGGSLALRSASSVIAIKSPIAAGKGVKIVHVGGGVGSIPAVQLQPPARTGSLITGKPGPTSSTGPHGLVSPMHVSSTGPPVRTIPATCTVPPVPGEMLVFFVLLLEEKKQNPGGLEEHELLLGLRQQFPYYRTVDVSSIHILERLVKSGHLFDQSQSHSSRLAISPANRAFSTAVLFKSIIENLSEFVSSCGNLEDVKKVFQQIHAGQQILSSKFLKQTADFRLKSGAPWDFHIPEDVLLAAAIMGSGDQPDGSAAYSTILAFIYDNYPYYRVTRTKFGGKVTLFSTVLPTARPSTRFFLTEPQRSLYQQQLVANLDSGWRRYLARPEALHPALPPVVQTYLPPHLANDKFTKPPVPVEVLLILAVSFVSDDRGWANSRDVSLFISDNFPHYATAAGAAEFSSAILDADFLTSIRLFNIAMHQGSRFLQLKYDRLMSAMAWLFKCFNFSDNSENKEEYMRFPELIQTILNQPPPSWEDYYKYTPDLQLTTPLEAAAPPLQTATRPLSAGGGATSSGLPAAGLGVANVPVSSGIGSATLGDATVPGDQASPIRWANSPVSQAAEVPPASEAGGTQGTPPPPGNTTVKLITINRNLFKANSRCVSSLTPSSSATTSSYSLPPTVPSSLCPPHPPYILGSGVPVVSVAPMEQSVASIPSEPVASCSIEAANEPPQSTDEEEVEWVPEPTPAVYERPDLEVHLKIGFVRLLAAIAEFQEEDLSDEAEAPENDVQLSQFSLIQPFQIVDLIAVLPTVFPFYEATEHLREFLEKDIKCKKGLLGKYLNWSRGNDGKLVYEYKEAMVGDVLQEMLSLPQIHDSATVAAWFRRPDYLNILVRNHLPFSETTLTSIAMFLVGDPNNRYTASLENVTNCFIKQLEFTCVGMSGKPWATDRLRKKLVLMCILLAQKTDIFHLPPSTIQLTFRPGMDPHFHRENVQATVSQVLGLATSLSPSLVSTLTSLLSAEKSTPSLLPPYNRTHLISLALRNLCTSPGAAVLMSKIWAFLASHFPFFKSATPWTLQEIAQDSFFRGGNPFILTQVGSDFTVMLPPKTAEDVSEEISAFTREHELSIQASMSNPQDVHVLELGLIPLTS